MQVSDAKKAACGLQGLSLPTFPVLWYNKRVESVKHED